MRRSPLVLLTALTAVTAVLWTGPPANAALGPAELVVTPAGAGGPFEGSAGRLFPGRGGYALTGVGLWREGTATATRTVPGTTGRGRFFVEAGADLCAGGPTMVVSVAGTEVLRTVVDVEHGTYALPGRYPAGLAGLSIRYEGERRTATCDRALKVYGVQDTAYGPGVRVGPLSLLRRPTGAGTTRSTADGAELLMPPGTAAVRRVTTAAVGATVLVVDAAAPTGCAPAGVLVARVDGREVGLVAPSGAGRSRTWLPVPGDLDPGPHFLELAHDTNACPVGVREVALVAAR